MERIIAGGSTARHCATSAHLDWRPGSGKTIEIFDIEVKGQRRAGTGRAMVNELLSKVPNDCNLIWAITRSTNLVAQQFYEELGFRVVGVLRNFYKTEHDDPDGVDAVMYGRDVGPGAPL